VAKIDADVLISQVRRAKGRLAHDGAEVSCAARLEPLATREQEVAFAVLPDLGGQGGELFTQVFAVRLTGRETRREDFPTNNRRLAHFRSSRRVQTGQRVSDKSI
jgi:hypothetical protein